MSRNDFWKLSLAVLAVLALPLALWLQGADQDLNPKVMLYANTNGGGGPVIRGDGSIDTLAVRRLSRWPMLTLNTTPWADKRTDVLVLLRQMNPKQILLAYDTVGERFYYGTAGSEWAAEWSVAQPYMLWDTASNPFPYPAGISGFPVQWPNLGARAFTDTLSALWVKNVLWSGLWSGAFFDFMGSDIWWAHSLNGLEPDRARSGFTSGASMDSARRVNMLAMSNRVRAAGGNGFLIVGNGGTPREWQGWDGELRESWTDDKLPAYIADTRRYSIVKVESWAQPYSSEWCRAWRNAITTACMGKGWAYSGPDRNLNAWPGVTYLSLWPDEASVTHIVPGMTDGRTDTTGWNVGWLGDAAGDAREVAPGVWRRDFKFGAALKNTTGAAVSVDMLAPYWRRIYGLHDPIVNNGALYRVQVIPAHDGILLLALPRDVRSAARGRA